MVKKAVLAKFIKQGPHSLSEWHDFLPSVTGLRVKGVGSQGAVLISLDDSGWYRPTDWVSNYQQSIRERLDQELKTAETVLLPEQMETLILQYVAPQEKLGIDSIKRGFMENLARRAYEPQIQRISELFVCAMRILDAEELSQELIDLVIQYPYVEP